MYSSTHWQSVWCLTTRIMSSQSMLSKEHTTYYPPRGSPLESHIVRDHHPLQGHALDVYGHTHRHGVLHLTLVLPDGSRALIPAGWTDLNPQTSYSDSPNAAVLIGSRADLVHARKVVDSLLRTLNASEKIPSKEERERATATRPLAGRGTEHVGRSRSRGKENAHRPAIEADRQGGSSKTRRGAE